MDQWIMDGSVDEMDGDNLLTQDLLTVEVEEEFEFWALSWVKYPILKKKLRYAHVQWTVDWLQYVTGSGAA